MGGVVPTPTLGQDGVTQGGADAPLVIDGNPTTVWNSYITELAPFDVVATDASCVVSAVAAASDQPEPGIVLPTTATAAESDRPVGFGPPQRFLNDMPIDGETSWT